MEPKSVDENSHTFFATEVHWIGVHDTNVEGQFVYESSGTSITYSAWSIGEPNNLGDEHCAMKFPSGSWNDGPCEDLHYYVCEQVYGA